MVLDTAWNRRSNDASNAAVELRAPWPLAASEPAAIFQALSTNDRDEGEGVMEDKATQGRPRPPRVITYVLTSCHKNTNLHTNILTLYFLFLFGLKTYEMTQAIETVSKQNQRWSLFFTFFN